MTFFAKTETTYSIHDISRTWPLRINWACVLPGGTSFNRICAVSQFCSLRFALWTVERSTYFFLDDQQRNCLVPFSLRLSCDEEAHAQLIYCILSSISSLLNANKEWVKSQLLQFRDSVCLGSPISCCIYAIHRWLMRGYQDSNFLVINVGLWFTHVHKAASTHSSSSVTGYSYLKSLTWKQFSSWHISLKQILLIISYHWAKSA